MLIMVQYVDGFATLIVGGKGKTTGLTKSRTVFALKPGHVDSSIAQQPTKHPPQRRLRKFRGLALKYVFGGLAPRNHLTW